MRDELTAADIDHYERTGEYPAGWNAWGFRFEITKLARIGQGLAVPEERAIEQLLFVYESILTEMRAHTQSGHLIASWVSRLDAARDEAAQAGVKAVVSPLVAPVEKP